MAKRKRKKPSTGPFIRPTDERASHNVMEGAGAAIRIIPPIKTLFDAGKLTQAEYDALDHYRTQSHQAQDDARQSSTNDPAKMMGGGGGVSGSKIPRRLLQWSPAMEEVRHLDKKLGSLQEIANYIAVDDNTLTSWCIAKNGSRERYKAGVVVQIVPRAEKRVMAEALQDLKQSAKRLAR